MGLLGGRLCAPKMRLGKKRVKTPRNYDFPAGKIAIYKCICRFLFACGALYLLCCPNYEPTPYTAILREPKILFANHTAAIFQQENHNITLRAPAACSTYYAIKSANLRPVWRSCLNQKYSFETAQRPFPLRKIVIKIMQTYSPKKYRRRARPTGTMLTLLNLRTYTLCGDPFV